MRQSSHQPSDPAYYIEDCRILKYSPKFKTLLSDWSAIQNWNWFFTNKIHTTKELDFESWFLFSIYMLYGTYVLLLHISWSHSYSTVAVVLGGQGAVQWWHGSSYYFAPVCFTRESAAFCTLLELHQFYFMKNVFVCLFDLQVLWQSCIHTWRSALLYVVPPVCVSIMYGISGMLFAQQALVSLK